jgi:hypothetical protein
VMVVILYTSTVMLKDAFSDKKTKD